MSFRIEALRSDINAVLQQTEYREHTTIEMTPPSAVSHDNPHRFILDEIRDDLLHLDREKVARIIFMVNQHCAKHEPTSVVKPKSCIFSCFCSFSVCNVVF